MRNLQEQVKKAFCYKIFTDLSLFKYIVLVFFLLVYTHCRLFIFKFVRKIYIFLTSASCTWKSNRPSKPEDPFFGQIFANSQTSALNFKKNFLITRTIFSHTRSEQFWKQNTISLFFASLFRKTTLKCEFRGSP